MKFLLILVILVSSANVHAEEPSFQFTFGSNIKNFPIQFNKSNQKIKKIFSINLNEWNVSPTFNSFTNDKFTSSSYKKKNIKEKLFLKLKLKF